MLAPDAYYQDFWNYAGWYGEEAARQTYGAYAPPVGSQPPAAEPAVPGVEPAARASPFSGAGGRRANLWCCAADLRAGLRRGAAGRGASCTGAWRYGRVRRRQHRRRPAPRPPGAAAA